MKKRLAPLITMFILNFIIVPLCAAADEDLPVLETQVKTVALFKNGLGFVIREGATPLKNGWAVTRHVPEAVLGGIWFGCLDPDARLEEVVGFKNDRTDLVDAITTSELLQVNIGKRAIIHFGDMSLDGRIKAVPANRPPAEDTPFDASGYRGYEPAVENAMIVIVETNQGEVAVNKDMITRVEFPDGMASRFHLVRETRNLKFHVSTPKTTSRIGMSYLEKGLTWTPAYLVMLEDEHRARITMQATVVNDAEDLKDAEMFFVVGYPHFLYANILSPMAMRQSINDFIAALSGGTGAGYAPMGNVMAQTSAPYAADESGVSEYNYSAVPGLTGEYEEDLFLYNKKGITLNKNERASYLLFSDRVEYKHVYEWEVPDLSGGDYDRGDEATREQVWHSLRLINSSQYPWTTAPALAVRDNKPLAQGMITYTAKGNKVNLKMTVAAEVKTDRREYETDRQRDINLYGYSYDLVTVKGELYVKNSKTSQITLDIRKLITGEVVSASHEGKIKKLAEGISRRRANSSSIITWEVPVNPGAEIKLTYSYKIYVSN